MFAHPDGAAADASQSPSAPQAASVADVPWLAAISALRDTPQLRGSAGLEAVEQALHWAAGRLEIRPHINSPIAFEHKQAHLAEVDALAAQRDSVFKVALLQALHPHLWQTPATAWRQRWLALLQRLASCMHPVPPGLTPEAQTHALPGWLGEAVANADGWLEPHCKPATRASLAPLAVWNNALALSALHHLGRLVRSQDDLLRVMLNGQPLAGHWMSAPKVKLLDTNSSDRLALHCQPWLARLLGGTPLAVSAPAPAMHHTLSLGGTKHLNDFSNGERRRHTGLKPAHLYYAALIERLGVLDSPMPQTEPTSMAPSETPSTLPPGSSPALPPELARALPSGLHAVVGLAVARADAFGAMAKSLTEKPSRIFRTRRAAPATPSSAFSMCDGALGALHLPNAQLRWRAADEPSSLGSFHLDGAALNPGVGLAWLDLTLVLRLNGQWAALPLVLDDDPVDPCRIHLRPLQPWPPALAKAATHGGLAQRLGQALPSASWAVDIDGAGALLCAAVVLG